MTSAVRPFSRYHNTSTLHHLEISSLTCTFLTLWAGSVFNTFPQCEDPNKNEGETLGWCDALSFIVSGLNILCVVMFVVVFFIAQCRKEDEKDDKRTSLDEGKKVDTKSEQKHNFGTFEDLDGGDEVGAGNVELTDFKKHRRETSNALIDGAWHRYFDEASQQWYGHNATTGETVWEVDMSKRKSVVVYQSPQKLI